MDALTGKQEQSIATPGEFFSCGIEKGTEILRYTDPDRSSSGIIFKYAGGLLTARHVIEAHKIPGFKAGQAIDVDIAFKSDPSCHGLPLGYVDRMILEGVDMITSTPEDPENLVVIPGRVGAYFLPTSLHPFQPRDSKRAAPYFKPGASGSPLVYKDHIIGLVSWQNLDNPHEVAVVVFSGSIIKKDMEELGLEFEEIR
jgi:hypothetical protein